MDFENQVLLLEEVSLDQIEVEVETSETYMLDPLTALSDHNYFLTEPKDTTKSIIPHNIKIRELKALYHCSKCGYATLKKDAMNAHSQTHKEKPKPVQPTRKYIPCPSCNVRKHPDLYERCTECSFFTKKKTSLKIHMRIHMREKPYKCTECEHRVENLKELIKHYEDGHSSIDKFRCDLCSFTTHTRAHLSAHTHSHGEARICAFCCYSTDKQGDMTKHMKTHYLKLK